MSHNGSLAKLAELRDLISSDLSQGSHNGPLFKEEKRLRTEMRLVQLLALANLLLKVSLILESGVEASEKAL